METISFALGIASVLIVLMGTVIVWATLRVIKLTKKTVELQRLIDHIERHIYSLYEKSRDDMSIAFKDVYTNIDKYNEETNRNVGQSNKGLEDYLTSKINDVSQDNKKYVDSRIDKLIDAYFIRQTSNTVNDVVSTTKQIIKG
jgi:hypothetical protein